MCPRGHNHWRSQDFSTGRGGGGHSEGSKRGGWPPCALINYANDSGVARIFQRGPKPGSKATEQGEGVESREIFEMLCIQNFIFCTLHYWVRLGVVPYRPIPYSFPCSPFFFSCAFLATSVQVV